MARATAVLINFDGPVAEVVALAALSEQLGYDRFWLTDVLFSRDCYVALAAAATATERIGLGPGVANPFSRHPAVTAALTATLDELSGGRALVGLGVGGATLAQIGAPPRLPVAAMRESVAVIRGLLAGDEVSIDGKVITAREATLACGPPRPAVPLYFATHGAQISRLAGEIADGVLLANILVPDALDYYLGLIEEGRQRQGRTADEVTVSLRFEVCLSDDRSAAASVMRRRVASRLLGQYPHWDYLDRLGVHLPEEFTAIAAAGGKADLAAGMAVLPDEVLEQTVLFGRPEEVAAQINQVLRPEITEITIRPHAVPGQAIGDVVRSFAKEVLPLVTEAEV